MRGDYSKSWVRTKITQRQKKVKPRNGKGEKKKDEEMRDFVETDKERRLTAGEVNLL